MQMLTQIFHFLSIDDLQTTRLVCRAFAEAAAHPSLIKNVCHNIDKLNLVTFLQSNQRFRNIVLTGLDLENRTVKRLWKHLSEDVVDLTLDKCEVRVETFHRMLRNAKQLRAFRIIGCGSMVCNCLLKYLKIPIEISH
jgi:hypothetical protein